MVAKTYRENLTEQQKPEATAGNWHQQIKWSDTELRTIRANNFFLPQKDLRRNPSNKRMANSHLYYKQCNPSLPSSRGPPTLDTTLISP
ncbi:hypothetical protein EUTSA_v10026684mg [Eutrema salsugineum]|uniref:Uncharacterized protein n=1 Tax=Eutrema salsugineum TaxID=72664 RepID=V4P601_EUTSA|nr:hypothetical protein EUTSA_v10026684mg [Eutrema salsugineum]